MNENDVICTCLNITVGDLKKAVDEGAQDYAQVQDKTGVGTICGACQEEAESIVADLLKGNS